MLAKEARASNPAIASIVMLYRLGVGSAVPGGAISSSLPMVTVLAAENYP